MKKGGLRICFQNSILLFCSLIACFLMLEFGLRLAGQEPSYYYPSKLFVSDRDLGYRLAPGFKVLHSLGEYEYHIAINSQGLRDSEHDIRGRYSILGLGDSFTFGTGLELKDTYLGVLEASLNEVARAEAEYDVVKGGVPGYGTDQELIYLKSYGIVYKPDMVIVGFCIPNDPDDNMQEKDTVVDGFLVSPKSEVSARADPFFTIKALLRKNIYTYSFIVNRLKSNAFARKALSKSWVGRNVFEKELQFYRADYSEYTDKAWERTFSVFRRMKDFADQNGIALCVMLIPTRTQVDEKQRQAVIRQFNIPQRDCDTLKPTRIIKAFLENEKIDYLDMTDALRAEIMNGRSVYFVLDGHWNKEGAQVAGRALARYLISSGRMADK